MRIWGVWGVVAIILLAGCGSAAAPTATPQPTNTAVPTATVTSTPLPTSTPTATVTSTPTPSPEPTATPTPLAGSTQDNPVPFGGSARYTIPNIGVVLEMGLTRAARGAEAEAIINASNTIRPETASAGEEFYAVHAEVTQVEGQGGFPIGAPVGWSAVIDGELTKAPIILMMQGQLMSSGLLPGVTIDGWVPFRVASGAEISRVYFSLGDEVPGIWFALEDQSAMPSLTVDVSATISPTVEVTQTADPPVSTAVGASRRNPVPMGQTARVTHNSGKTICDVAVTQIVRGAQATQMMQEAIGFDVVPVDTDLEWMVVYMKGQCPKIPEEGAYFGNARDMRIIADKRVIAQPLLNTPPTPSLEGKYFEGAEIEGWTAFFVKKLDPRPLLLIPDSFFDDTGVWFALGE